MTELSEASRIQDNFRDGVEGKKPQVLRLRHCFAMTSLRMTLFYFLYGICETALID